MGTNIGTLVTLDAVIGNPFGHIHCNPALLVLGCSGREGSIFASGKCTYRKIITCQAIDGLNHILHKFGNGYGLSAFSASSLSLAHAGSTFT